MARKLIQFEFDHLDLIEPQDEQAKEGRLDHSYDPGPSRTITRDGVVLMCGGIIPYGNKVGMPWSVISKHASCCDMLYIVRHTQDFLAEQLSLGIFGRLVFGVREGFKPGHRFAWMLGFDPWRVVPGIDNEPTMLYVRT